MISAGAFRVQCVNSRCEVFWWVDSALKTESGQHRSGQEVEVYGQNRVDGVFKLRPVSKQFSAVMAPGDRYLTNSATNLADPVVCQSKNYLGPSVQVTFQGQLMNFGFILFGRHIERLS